jgi:hypothetical protein
MGTTATAGNGNAFRRVPTGVHIARCVGVIDLGTQTVEFQGQSKDMHKLQIQWEVLGEDEAGVPMTIDIDGKDMPLTISKRYTLSLHEKASMRRDLEAWRGKPFDADDLKGFDVAKLLGAYCMLNVVEQEGGNGKTFANIQSITPLPRELAKHKPPGVHPLISFDVDNPDMAVFGSFYEKLQETIRASAEWRARSSKVAPAGAIKPAQKEPALADMDDDVPF